MSECPDLFGIDVDEAVFGGDATEQTTISGECQRRKRGARRLEATLKGSPRLGADASASGKPASSGLDPSAIYKRRAERAKGSAK